MNEIKCHAGSYREFIAFVAERALEAIGEGDFSLFGRINFGPVDRKFAEKSTFYEIKELIDFNGDWYGVRQIDAGFDDDDRLMLVSDYYGGGDFSFAAIHCSTEKSHAEEEADRMFRRTLARPLRNIENLSVFWMEVQE